ncbi:MAG: hypothetical protein KC776_09415 [Myxococcales bacterium]|nr:hypothetical protein [Myxococcales bacterium]MCB9581739.1 hypothetical protein [Polyangiaceae bacterium]
MTPRRPKVDLEGLLVALVLAPRTFSRNRFFALYQDASVRRVRRRAARVRGLIRQLLGEGRPKGEIIGEQVLEDGQVLLRLRVPELSFERTTALSALEAATLRLALSRAGAGKATRADKDQVEAALSRLGPELRPSAE